MDSRRRLRRRARGGDRGRTRHASAASGSRSSGRVGSELRQGRSTDASAYAQYFTDDEITKALVLEGSKASESTSSAASPIPGWEPPYLSAETTASADVVVVWTPDSRFEEWSKATVFSLEETSGAG